MAPSKTDGWLRGRPSARRAALFPSLAIVALAAGPTAAAPLQGFPAGREAAAAQGLPLAVCVHGAEWQRASRVFLDEVWRSAALEEQLAESLVLAEIGIGQSLDEAGMQRQAEATRGWDPKPVQTFPAVQIFAADGKLLKTIAGESFFAIADSPAKLGAELERVVAAARQRAELLRLLGSLEDRSEEFERQFLRLRALPVESWADARGLLQKTDPDNSLGLAGPLEFGGWNFIRETAGRAADGVTDEELAAVEAMLANPHYRPDQRALLWCGKGMLLAAAGRPAEAWEAYQAGHREDPEGAAGRAVLRHGHRTVGRRLRAGPAPDSPLAARLTGGNLTTDPQVTISLSSRDPNYDDEASHASLVRGETREFAFHTRDEAAAFVVVDLGEPCRVEAVEVANRTSQADRAAGLTLWTSLDGEAWEECWQAHAVRPDWLIDLTNRAGGGVKARYLKLGLPAAKSGFLHLRAVNAFGRRPE